MKLHWITTFEKIGPDTLQKVCIEDKNAFIVPGEIYKYCYGCRSWVSRHDYMTYCKDGYHEYSEKLELKKLKGSVELKLKYPKYHGKKTIIRSTSSKK